MIRNLKDKTLSRGLALALDKRIRQYGRILDLQLDSRNKRLELEILLKGEVEPLRVRIENYEVREEAGHWYLLAKELKSSREWIDILAREYLSQRPIEIPERYAKMLRMVI
ncbi:hypothetical protein [Nitratifractor sp.]|uniref:hypothetical protein n=1 Tax=Nitratifractor sp. TaxID=2268144 RepID=UPI0025D76142|nr:hypothetical protein [Nitratifractor sp.]